MDELKKDLYVSELIRFDYIGFAGFKKEAKSVENLLTQKRLYKKN